MHKHKENIPAPTRDSRPWRLAINLRMLKTLVMDFLVFKPEFSRRLNRIFFSTSSRLSRNFHGRLAGLAQIAAGGRLSRRLRRLHTGSKFKKVKRLQNYREDETGGRDRERYSDERVDPGGWMMSNRRM